MENFYSRSSKNFLVSTFWVLAVLFSTEKMNAQVTLNFTGLPDGPIGDYYNGGAGTNYGISFPTGSALNEQCYADPNPTISYPAGFSSYFTVDHSVCIGFRIRIFDAVDGGGTQLAMQEFGPSGMATINFCGTAKSVRLERFSCPSTGYDNMVFGPLVPAPEINLQGATLDIFDGDNTPSTADGTDHGTVLVNSPSDKTFTIQNTGTATLNISSITVTGANASEFVISGAPSTVAVGGSAVFTVTFTPTTLGLRSAVVLVNNDDCDEAVYDFAVQGTGTVAGAGLAFDGSNDHVSIPHSTSLNLGNNHTIEFWLKYSGTSFAYLTRKEFAQGVDLPAGGTTIRHVTWGDDANYTNGLLNDGNWHHYALVASGGNLRQLYRDGVVVGTNTNAYTMDQSSSPMYLGFTNGPAAMQLDEFRVWNRTLCAPEIQGYRNCELTGSEAGLVAYYKFNQGFAGGNNSGITTLTDATSNGNNGTLTNFALSGVASNWVAPGGVTSGSSCTPVLIPEINLQGASINILDGDNTPSTADGTDHGSVLVNSPSVKTFTIQNTGTATLNISSITVTGANASEFVISGAPSTVAVGGSAVFTVTFTPTTLGLRSAVVLVNNDDCDEAVYDFAVTGNGALPSAALNFDGLTTTVGDYVNVPDGASLDITSAVTVEAWINASAWKTNIADGSIVCKHGRVPQNTGVRTGYVLRCGANGTLNFTIGANNNTFPGVSSPAEMALNTWTHVAGVFDGSTIKIYINGVLKGSAPYTGTIVPNNYNLRIGNSDHYFTRAFQGSIDEVRVWNTARTCDEINQLRNCELTGSESGLVAYYKFNQGFANENNSGLTTLTDATSNGNNGTLTNFALNGLTSNWTAPGGVTTGTSCSAVIAPEINLQGNANNITDGTTATSTTNNTALGNTLNGIGKSRSFTIQNSGTDNLTVSAITFNGANAADFSVSGISLPATITPNSSQNITITCNPSTSGTKTATINIVNNDCDEGNYDFAFSATGTTAFTFSSGSDWATAANWDVEVVPTTANLISPRSVVIAQNCTMNDVTVAFATGTLLTVNSSTSLSPSLNTFITINAGATLTVQSNGFISQGRIDNYGTVNISGSYTAFYMTNRPSATMNVLSGGSYSCLACAETMMDASIINNSGTLNLGTGSTWQADVTNNASGIITDGALGTQITLGANSSTINNGSFVSRTAKTAGTFVNNGTLSMPPTCTFTVQSGGSFTNNNLVTVATQTALNINAGGTFVNNATVNGNGTIVQSSTFTNNNSAIIAPGTSPGVLTVTGDFDLGGATYNCEIDGTSASQFDLLNVSGTATLTSNSKLHLIFSVPIISGTTFDVLTAGTVSGTLGTATFANTGTGNVSGVIVSYPGGNTVRVMIASPLAVELVTFTAKEADKQVLLQWRTASETNNRGFEIQRSGNGINWQAIHFEPGHGTTTTAHDYAHTDELPLPAQNFYRLRQMDFDGRESYSNIEVVSLANRNRFTVFPNPISTGTLTILMDEKMDESTVEARLFNTTGQLVKSFLLENEASQTILISDLPSGVYALEVGKGNFCRIVVE